MGKKKLNSVLAVDIGSKAIKIAEIRSQAGQPVVSSLGIIATPEGAVDHYGMHNPDAVAAAIKQAISGSGATVGDVVASINGQGSVVVRTIEVPRMNEAELKDHMNYEISRNYPFAESTFVSDFRPLPSDDPNSANMDVIMAVSPESAVNSYVMCFKKTGKKLAAIDVQPLGLARSMETSYHDDLLGKTVCLIDIGHMATSINIYRDGKLLLPRQVPLGGDSFTESIAQNLSLSHEDAERLKIEEGEVPESAISAAAAPAVSANPFAVTDTGFAPYNPFSDDVPPAQSSEPTLGGPAGAENPFTYGDLPGSEDEPPATNPFAAPESAPAVSPSSAPVPQDNPEKMRIYNAFAAVLGEFADEVRRSIDYFRTRGGDVDMVLVCGGGSRLPGLIAFLGQTLDRPCDSYDPLKRLNVNNRKLAPDFVDEHRSEFAVAVGTGLHILYE